MIYSGGRFETKRQGTIKQYDVSSAYPWYINHKRQVVFYFPKKVTVN